VQGSRSSCKTFMSNSNVPQNNGLHQTGRGGVAFPSRRRPVIEARPAGEPECSTLLARAPRTAGT
jgi:hypothetical protein